MQLYLDSFSAFLSVKDGQFQIRLSSGEKRLFAVRTVSAILLTKGTALSTDAALLAMDGDIPVILIDAQTHYPLGQIQSGRPGSIATIRKNQLGFSRSGEGMQWVAEQIAAKIEGQRMVLVEWCETRPAFRDDVESVSRMMTNLANRFIQWTPPEDFAGIMSSVAETFRGQEGTASRLYFDQIAALLEGKMDFPGRMKRPAFDPFNATLNYLYGMLYTSVHLALLKSGVDPYIGVLHVDRYGGAPVMTFDFIEPYRPWADRVALDLADSGRLTADCFEPDREDRGLWLSREGKSEVVDAMLAYLQAATLYNGKNVPRIRQMELDAQTLAQRLKNAF